jgi:hypothetical protein
VHLTQCLHLDHELDLVELQISASPANAGKRPTYPE